MTSAIDVYRKQKVNWFSIMKGYSETWGYRKLLFCKGGRTWGNQTRMQFELAGNSSQLQDLVFSYSSNHSDRRSNWECRCIWK